MILMELRVARQLELRSTSRLILMMLRIARHLEIKSTCSWILLRVAHLLESLSTTCSTRLMLLLSHFEPH